LERKYDLGKITKKLCQEKNDKETENFFSEGVIPHILDDIMADYCQ